jgi:hypothetical protein
LNRLSVSNICVRSAQAVRRLVPMLLLGAMMLLLAAPALASGKPTATLPPLGTASSFGVLSGSAVTNTGPTTVRGDLGVSPGSAVTGFPPGIVIGTIHAGDSVAAQAQSDATIAYNNAAGQACGFNLTGQDLGGMVLIPGVYCFDSSAQLTGQLTFDGQGDPNSVFIIQIGSTLTTASNAQVLTIGQAQPCRIFWQVGSSATLGTDTSFAGNILALTSITLITGATTETGLYARNGAVTLDTNDIQACGQVPVATNTPTPVAASTATSTVTPAVTATVIPATNTAVPAATSTAAATATAILGTNTPTVVATNTPINIPTQIPANTQVPGATSTATQPATSTSTQVPPTRVPTEPASNTAIPNTSVPRTPDVVTATPTSTATLSIPSTVVPSVTPRPTDTSVVISTVVNTPSATVTPAGTAISISGSPTSSATPTAPAGTATSIQTETLTQTPGSTSTTVVPGGTPTETMDSPVPPILLPPTGGGFSWAAPMVLLVGVLLLAAGLGALRLSKRRLRSSAPPV